MNQDVNRSMTTPRSNGGSSSEYFKRAYKACTACRAKKVKCDLGSVDEPREPPCKRCRRESKPCIMAESNRGRSRRAASSRSSQLTINNINSSSNNDNDVNTPSGFNFQGNNNRNSTNNHMNITVPNNNGISLNPSPQSFARLQQQPLAALQTAPQPQQDHDHHPAGSSSVESSTVSATISNIVTPTTNMVPCNITFDNNTRTSTALTENRHEEQSQSYASEVTTKDTFNSLERVDIHNQSDALRVLAGVASNDGAAGHDKTRQPSMPSHPSDTPGSASSAYKKSWSSSKLIRNKIITKREAIELTTLFLESLYPFGPQLDSLPRCLEPEHLLVGKDEVLLGAILSVSSRYYRPKGLGSAVRAELIQQKLWNWTRQYIAEALWNEKCRSIAVVEALLILTEWATKGIHFDDNDYTVADENDDVDEDDDRSDYNSSSKNSNTNGTSSLFVAARRFDGQAYMFIGNAVRICHQLGLHKEEVYTVKNMRKIGYEEYSRQLQTYLHTLDSDCSISIRLGNEFASLKVSPPWLINVKDQLEESKKLERIEQDADLKWSLTFAKLELFILLRSFHELLSTFRLHVDETACERIMRLVGTELISWAAKYKSLFSTSPPSQAFRIALEYHYVRLYAYGTILEARLRARRTKRGPLPLLYSDSLFYLLQSVKSAQKIIEISTRFRDITLSSSLTYAPAPLFLLVVYAALFLIKVSTSGKGILPLNECVQSLRKASDHLIFSSFDDLHLSKRYGELLRNFCNQLEQIASKSESLDTSEHNQQHMQIQPQNSSTEMYIERLGNGDNSAGQDNPERDQEENFHDLLGIDVSSPSTYNISGLNTETFSVVNGQSIGNFGQQDASTYFDEQVLFNMNEPIDAPFLSSEWFDNFVDNIQTNLADS